MEGTGTTLPPATAFLLRPYTFLSTPVSKIIGLYFSLNVKNQGSHSHKTGEIVFLYIWKCTSWDNKLEEKRLWTER